MPDPTPEEIAAAREFLLAPRWGWPDADEQSADQQTGFAIVVDELARLLASRRCGHEVVAAICEEHLHLRIHIDDYPRGLWDIADEDTCIDCASEEDGSLDPKYRRDFVAEHSRRLAATGGGE